jgi:hypothetical protein
MAVEFIQMIETACIYFHRACRMIYRRIIWLLGSGLLGLIGISKGRKAA